MSHVYLAVICSLCALALATVQALPQCADDDEACREHLMHPDLPGGRTAKRVIAGEDTNNFWLDESKKAVREKLSATLNTNRAKNVIMFLGDGMSLTTLASARNLLGGEEKYLSFEKFPYTGLSKTYSVDQIVADSACTATAYLAGVKAIYGTIGVNGKVNRGDCAASKNRSNHVDSIAKWALEAGKSAGVVTNTRITDASPAGAYAHVGDRNWENDKIVSDVCGPDSGIQDIAFQLMNGDVGSKLKVILGGGKAHLVDHRLYENGKRTDGVNLINQFITLNPKNKFVETREELQNVDAKTTDRVLGIFHDDNMSYHLDTDSQTKEPTLEEMTRKAIELLSSDKNGYFVFIEGGRIDSAHHENEARIALDETVEFSKAIQAARELTSEEDTLIVVTSDHSHTLSYAGYQYRGDDVFGRAPSKSADGKPYLTLSYASGPSFSKFYDVQKHERRDPTKIVTGKAHDQFPSTIPRSSESHGGEDVAVFASGPWAHLFTGVYEQNTIPHMMAYAACWGKGLTACKK